MSKDVEKILEAALALPADERAELVASILSSIDEDPAVVSAQLAESRARLSAFRRGELNVLSSEDALRLIAG
jgi:putative addiction module component (TIGR02574 family)